MMWSRRTLIANAIPAAAALVTFPAIASRSKDEGRKSQKIADYSYSGEPYITERWIAFGHLPTDEIWWRYDVIKNMALVMPSSGMWELSQGTIEILSKCYSSWLRSYSAEALLMGQTGTKLTLHGPLRGHRSSDHDTRILSATQDEIAGHYNVFEGPPKGWA